jgi:hypothetical protein
MSERKTFDELLEKFIYACEREFGVRDGITEIALSHELFNRVMYSMYEKQRYGCRFSDISDCKLLGVRLIARERDPHPEKKASAP